MARANRNSRLDLHDALSRRTFHNAVICTYTFEPLFFEDCLEKFASLSSNGNISVVTDRSTYHKIAFMPKSQRPKLVNLRYLLHPVEVRGCFHTKLFLLSTKATGRLIVGSANFTHAGLTSNAELVDVFDFEANAAEDFLPLFQDAFGFLASVAKRWPAESFASNVRTLQWTTPWLSKTPNPAASRVRLINNLDRPLWDQISSLVRTPVDRVHVVSRFFDETPKLIDRVVQDWHPQSLIIYTQNGFTTMTHQWLSHPYVRSGRAEILLCTYEDDGHQHRFTPRQSFSKQVLEEL